MEDKRYIELFKEFEKECKQAGITDERKIERLWDLYWKHTKIEDEIQSSE